MRHGVNIEEIPARELRPAPEQRNELEYADYRDKVAAGWLGKCLGGVVGGPLENHKQWLN